MSDMRHSIYSILGILCIASTTGSLAARNSKLIKDFAGIPKRGGVKLAWRFEKWPSKLVGVTVRRRIVGQTDWETISQTPVGPAVLADLNLEQVVQDNELRKILKQKLTKYREQSKNEDTRIFFPPWLAKSGSTIDPARYDYGG